HGTLAEVVIDPKDRGFVEGSEQDAIELPRGGGVVAERLLDDDAGAARSAHLDELLDDQFEQHGRDGKEVQRAPGGTQLLADAPQGRGVLVVAVDGAQRAARLVERRGIEPAVLFQAVLGARLELFKSPTGLRYTDDRHVEMAPLHHGLQRRKDLL